MKNEPTKKNEDAEHRLARAAWRVFVHSPSKNATDAFAKAEEFAIAARTRLAAVLDKTAESKDDAAKRAADLDAACERGDITK